MMFLFVTGITKWRFGFQSNIFKKIETFASSSNYVAIDTSFTAYPD